LKKEPQEDKEENDVPEEGFKEIEEKPFKKYVFIVSGVLILALIIFSFTSSYKKMNEAREIFERISAHITERAYLKKQFIEDYNLLQARYTRSFYARQAEILYEDYFLRYSGKKKTLIEVEAALKEADIKAVKKAIKEKPAKTKDKLSGKTKIIEKNSKSVKASYLQAEKMVNRGDYASAIELLRKVQASSSEKKKQEIEQRIQEIQQAKAQHDKYYKFLINRAYFLEQNGFFRKSLDYYYEALKINPHSKYCRNKIKYIKHHYLSSPLKEYSAKAQYIWRKFWHSKDKLKFLYLRKIEDLEAEGKYKEAALLYRRLGYLKGNKYYYKMACLEKKMFYIR
jgi:hypothetical protein